MIGSVYMDLQEQYDSKITALNAPAQSINIITAPLIVIGQGPFPTIITGISEIITLLNSNTPTEDTVADPNKSNGLYDLNYKITCALMNILIGKAGILEKIPIVGEPVAAALRGLESAIEINVLSKGLKKIKDTEKRNKLENELSETMRCIAIAIQKYQGLSL